MDTGILPNLNTEPF